MIPQSALIIVAIIDDISDHGAMSSDAYCTLSSTNRTNITTAAPVANNHIIIIITIIITLTITISSIILIIIIHQSSDLLHTTSGM